MSRKRIGLSMRVSHAEDYQESRDAIAWDWFTYLGTQFPDIQVLLIPNLGSEVVDYVKSWQLDGVILSGGNDIGSEPRRDQTEKALLDLCLNKGMPLFGVCRALQLIQTHLGGSLMACDPKTHRACRHEVNLSEPYREISSWQVNSYHCQGILIEDLAPPLELLAWSRDGLVEAARHPQAPLCAVMWHPERDSPSGELDRAMISATLEL